LNSSINFAQPEIALRLDSSGIIRKALSSNEIVKESVGAWVGQQWADTVSVGRTHVRQMMVDARTTGVSPLHRVRQRFPSGVEVSVAYTTVRLGAEAGFIAIGRDIEVVAGLQLRLISAQKSIARDSWKLRDVATRHRALLEASSRPVVLVDATDLEIREANPAARRALGLGPGQSLLPSISSQQDRDELRAMLVRVGDHGKAWGIVLTLGPERRRWHVRASSVHGSRVATFLLRLAPADSGGVAGAANTPLMVRLRDAVVVLDAHGFIVRANPAFLDLVQHGAESEVLDQPLDRWLSHSLALSAAGRSAGGGGSPRALKARGELGALTDVMVYQVGTTDLVCVLLQSLSRSTPTGSNERPLAPRAVIDDTVASVERRCFLSALELARGDRRVVLEMLGLSVNEAPMRDGLPTDEPGSAQ
jgi:transcriptional regulator PpsR